MSAAVEGARGAALIALEGIDGVGKSTVLERATARLRDLRVVGQSTKQVATKPDFAYESMTQVADLLWPKAETAFDHLFGPSYWLHLQALWYTLASRFVLRPKLEAGTRLLVDGWYYRFYAKLRMRGFESGFLDAAFGSSVEPDLVILLDRDVASLWGRKRFRPHEMGLHEGYVELGRESFLDYQGRVRSALAALAGERGWVTIGVADDEDPDRTAERVEQAVRDFLRPRAATSGSGAAVVGDVRLAERKLHELWCTLLHTEEVGLDQTFFEAGGDSLLLGILREQINGVFDVRLPAVALFEFPTIRLLAQRIVEMDADAGGPVARATGRGS
jgi:dTMP kinase